MASTTTVGAMMSRRARRLSNSAAMRRLLNNAEVDPAFDAVDPVDAKSNDIANLGLVANWGQHCGVPQLDLGALATVRQDYAVEDFADMTPQRNGLEEVDAGSFKGAIASPRRLHDGGEFFERFQCPGWCVVIAAMREHDLVRESVTHSSQGSSDMGIDRGDRSMERLLGHLMVEERLIAGTPEAAGSPRQQRGLVRLVGIKGANAIGIADLFGPLDLEGPGGAPHLFDGALVQWWQRSE